MSIGGRNSRLATMALCGTLALVVSTGIITPSYAQIEEVIVTAERHSENIQNVPLSVTTLSDDQLSSAFQDGQDIRVLAARVPSLYVESSNGRIAPRFYIRGLGNTDFDLAASQPVSIIMDDIVMENTVLKSSPLFDIQDVEISRGPQGTLFGRNTTAGIVKFTSKKPTFDWQGNATVSYGSYGTFNFEGGVGGPIIPDKLAFRLSALIQDRSDYVDNFDGVKRIDDYTGGYRDHAGRIELLWTPTNDLSVLLNLHGRSFNGTAALFRANIFTKGSNKLNKNYHFDQTFFDGGGGNPQKYNGYGTSAKIDYTLPGVTVTSITGFETTQGTSRGDIDGGNLVFGPGVIPFPADTQDGIDHLGQVTQEVHLASNTGGRLFWQAGAYYFWSDLRVTTLGPPPGIGFPPPTHVRQTNRSYALFGQASYQLTDDFTVTAGLRWTRDDKHLTSPSAAKVSPSASNLSWDVSGTYKLTPDVNLYGRIATGFRAPSIQGRNIAFFAPASTAKSETITSFEGGVKSELFDRRVRLNMDGFYYTINNMQLTAIGGPGNLNQLLNADRGRAWGLEMDSEEQITPHLLVTAGVSYTNSKIESRDLTTGICGGGCTVTNPLFNNPSNPGDPRNGNPIIDGNPFPQAPEVIGSFTARYDVPVGADGDLFFFTDWTYQGYTNFFLYKSKEFFSDGNFEGGMKLGYTGMNGLYEVAVFARNVTNEANVQGAIDFNNLTGFVGDPRIIGVSLSMKY